MLDRDRQLQALTNAERKALRLDVGHLPEPEPVEHLVDALAPLGDGEIEQLGVELEVFPDRELAVEREGLRHVADAPPHHMRLRDWAYECPLIFCGYSIADPHIQQIIFDMTDKSISRPMYYAVMPGVSQPESRYWASNNITCIDATFENFLIELDRQILPLARQLRRTVSPEKLSLQNHYKVAGAIESDSLRFYIENDATHLHSTIVVAQQTPIEFYKGYDTGFGCILQNLDITRHVTDSILVDAVLADEAAARKTEVFLIKGPAGNGKSVILKRLAWEAGVTY